MNKQRAGWNRIGESGLQSRDDKPAGTGREAEAPLSEAHSRVSVNNVLCTERGWM